MRPARFAHTAYYSFFCRPESFIGPGSKTTLGERVLTGVLGYNVLAFTWHTTEICKYNTTYNYNVSMFFSNSGLETSGIWSAWSMGRILGEWLYDGCMMVVCLATCH